MTGGDVLLSVVMPVYNEVATLRQVVERVLAVTLEKEIVVVDDGSRDGSAAVLDELQQLPNVRVFRHPENRGKGAALRTGFQQARGDLVIIQDADLEYDPQDYPKVMAPILAGEADVVYGSRYLADPGDPHRGRSFFHTLGNRFLTWCSNLVTGLELTDMETCYKCFRREALAGLEIESRRFTVEPELTGKIARRELRVHEVPIRYAARGYGQGKKITWRDGLAALWAIWKYR